MLFLNLASLIGVFNLFNAGKASLLETREHDEKAFGSLTLRSPALIGDLPVGLVSVPNINLSDPANEEGHILDHDTPRHLIADQFIQIGSDLQSGLYIGGTNRNESLDEFGNHRSIALSDDGSIMAVAARYGRNSSGQNVGYLKVYEQTNGSWSQKGTTIYGNGGSFGQSVSLSGDGMVVAVSAHIYSNGIANRGSAHVYHFENGSWSQRGEILLGANPYEFNGYNLSLSGDGSVFALSSNGYLAPGTPSGRVRVYEYLSESNTWLPRGDDILITGHMAAFGWSVGLSSDGFTVALGSGDSYINNGDGFIRIYKYISNKWSQLGQELQGVSNSNQSFGFSLTLSGNGLTLAAGCQRHHGQVRVFTFKDGSWTQVGQDIQNEGTSSGMGGQYVSISNDGKLLLVSFYTASKNIIQSNSGYVSLYYVDATNNTLVKIGGDIESQISNDLMGAGLAISGDGTTIAFGSRISGVRAFRVVELPSSFPSMKPSYDPSITPSQQPSTSNKPSSGQPTLQPSGKPSVTPIEFLSISPSSRSQSQHFPSISPSKLPSVIPTVNRLLTEYPSNTPTNISSMIPSPNRNKVPSSRPSSFKSSSQSPSMFPTVAPVIIFSSMEPSFTPTDNTYSSSPISGNNPTKYPNTFVSSSPQSHHPSAEKSFSPATKASFKPSSITVVSNNIRQAQIAAVAAVCGAVASVAASINVSSDKVSATSSSLVPSSTRSVGTGAMPSSDETSSNVFEQERNAQTIRTNEYTNLQILNTANNHHSSDINEGGDDGEILSSHELEVSFISDRQGGILFEDFIHTEGDPGTANRDVSFRQGGFLFEDFIHTEGDQGTANGDIEMNIGQRQTGACPNFDPELLEDFANPTNVGDNISYTSSKKSGPDTVMSKVVDFLVTG